MTRLLWLTLFGLGKVIEHLGERLAEWAKDKAFPQRGE